MCVLCQRETVQIGDYRQNMLIDGILMKQVVLHLSHDLAEIGQISPQYAHFVHMLQGTCRKAWRFQYAQEKGLICRIVTEIAVDVDSGMPHGAQGPCRHVFEIRAL